MSESNKIVKRHNKKGFVKYELILISEKRPRALGTMNKEGELVVRRNPVKHFHHKANGYGFNSELLHERLDKKQPIILRLVKSKSKYVLTPEYIIANGIYLHFLARGFETQIFLDVSKIESNEITKTRTKESILESMSPQPA